MASSGNTWQKKLIERQKRYVRKVRGIKKPFAIDNGNEIAEPVRPTVMFGRQPRRFGSVPSALPRTPTS